MITNDVQHRSPKAHLERFEQASTNLAAGPGERGKLEQLEFDAANAQADDLRAAIVEYERHQLGQALRHRRCTRRTSQGTRRTSPLGGVNQSWA